MWIFDIFYYFCPYTSLLFTITFPSIFTIILATITYNQTINLFTTILNIIDKNFIFLISWLKA